MKVVINDTFGGFSLSHQGVMRYAELKGIKLFPWVDDMTAKIYGKDFGFDDVPWLHYTTVPKEEYEAIQEGGEQKPVGVGRFAKLNKLYFSFRDIPRTDPDLIKVIREMGAKANGKCAKLKIINIPEDIEYTIEEYDGLEHIAEKHMTWR